MRPETRSQTLLSITRSKAKMYEYGVPQEYHIAIPIDPARLFSLSIGLLGDLAAQTNSRSFSEEYLKELRENLQFSARFFDAYLQSRLNQHLDPYLILLASASYYLCGLPGSSRILARHLNEDHIDLNCLGLESLLLWLLRGNISNYTNVQSELYGEHINDISSSLIEFYRSGSGKDDLFENASKLRRKAYDVGTPRQLLFADVICAIVKKFVDNSAWFCLPQYSDIPVEQWSDVLRKTTFMRELWPAQQLLGEKGAYKGKSAVVQMPTSAGKTRATEIIIRSAFLANRTSLAVIVAPFRALCHEIRNSLSGAFRGEPVNIDELSDVLQSDFNINELLGQKQILVITPEKLVYVLRHNPEIAEQIGLLIYDEGHQFDTGIRGITYELLVTSLKSMVPKGIQTILISAVIMNADSIGKWLYGDDFELVYGTKLIPTYRTIAFTSWLERRGRLEFINPEDPDKGEFWVPRVIDQQRLNLKGKERKEREFPNKEDGQTIALFLGLKLVANGSIAIFCGRKDSAENLCEKVVDAYDRGLTIRKPIEFSDKDEAKRLWYLYSRNLGDEAAATRSAYLGVFTHHGNMPHGIRLAVEHAMKNARVGFVICTSTLAQGVNLPIRYLLVTGIYQGVEPIKVRDFHNLLGRAGRADQHTEGSVIFADPDIYDNRNTREGKWRWRKYKELLNPDNSEPCISSLLSIFDPLYSHDGESRLQIGAVDIVAAYVNNTLDEFMGKLSSQYEQIGFTKDVLESQITEKTNIFSSIENYLMAHCDESKAKVDSGGAEQLAVETLAYFLASDEQKEQLVRIFEILEHNIEQNVPDVSKRKVYGRTLYGVHTSVKIEDWLNQHIEELITCNEHDELLKIMWAILAEGIQNNTFKKCDPPEVLFSIALEWTHGKTFSELFSIMLESNICLIAGKQRRHPKIESVVDICDNGFAYDGSLFLGAVAEIVGLVRPQGSMGLVSKLLELQKKLKYGLPTPTCIALYELGFADRVVALDLSSIVQNTRFDRRSIIRTIRRNEQKVRQLLEKYPSYFIERLNNLS